MFGLALAATVRDLEDERKRLIVALDNSQRRENQRFQQLRETTDQALALTERCKALLGSNVAPAQLAEVFVGMSDSQQAEFFNRVGKITDEWKSPGRFMQFGAMGGYLDMAGSQLLNELAMHTVEFKQEIDAVPPDTDAMIERAVFEAMRNLAEETGRHPFGIELIATSAHVHPEPVRKALYSLAQKGKVNLNDHPPADELYRIQSASLSLDVPV